MKSADRTNKAVLWVGLAILGPSAFAFALPQAQSQPAQSSSGSQSQAQSQPQQKDDSSADAPKKPPKDKPKPKKVYTEEDLSGLRGNGVSVVGDPNAPVRSSALASQSSAGDAAKSVRDEEYWRGRASQVKEQMAATDEAIKNLQAEIKKNGATGFDAQSGLKDNVIYVDDRNARLKQLEQRRQDLDKQMDLLQEEGRKAGADSAWFR
jgi:hypothetical protein